MNYLCPNLLLCCRIDVYVDGEYVVPENAEMNGDDLEYKTPVDRSGCEFCPTVESANGANFQVGSL